MTEETFTITICPSCSSPRIEKICGRWSATYEGETYEVEDLEYYSCPDCGEKVYPPAAMRRIQERSPGYSRRPHGRGGRVAANPATGAHR